MKPILNVLRIFIFCFLFLWNKTAGATIIDVIGNATLSTGAGLSAPFTDGDTLRYTGTYTIYADIFANYYIDINGQSPGFFTNTNSSFLKGITDSAGGTQKLPIEVAGSSLTIQDPLWINFIDYMKFTGSSSRTFILKFSDPVTYETIGTNMENYTPYNVSVHLDSQITFIQNSIGFFKNFNNLNINGCKITFIPSSGCTLTSFFISNEPSELELNSSVSGNFIENNNITGPGLLTLNALTNPLTISGTGAIGKTGSPFSKIFNVKFKGDSNININLTSAFIGKNLIFDNSRGVTINSSGVYLADSGSITQNRNTNITKATIVATGPFTANLGSYAMTLNRGSITPTGATTFNTTFDSDSGSGGRIIMDNAGGFGSTLNLAGATSVDVVLTASSDLPPEGQNYSYKLFEATNGGVITMPVGVAVNFTSNETNQALTWRYDPDTNSLYTTENLQQVVDNVEGGGNNDNNGGVGGGNVTQNEVNLVTELVNSAQSGNSDAREAVNGLALIQASETAAAVSSLINGDTAAASLSEASDANLSQTYSRIIRDFVPIEINFTETEGSEYASAGEEPTKYGVWIGSFFDKAVQKRYSGNNGYKLKNYGFTLGADYMVNPILTLGLA